MKRIDLRKAAIDALIGWHEGSAERHWAVGRKHSKRERHWRQVYEQRYPNPWRTTPPQPEEAASE